MPASVFFFNALGRPIFHFSFKISRIFAVISRIVNGLP